MTFGLGRLGKGHGRLGAASSSGPSYSAEARAIFALHTGSLSTAHKQAMDTAITSLKAANRWTTRDRLWVPAFAANATDALLNWRNPGTGSLVPMDSGNLVFSPGVGFRSNGSSSYLKTGFNPATAGGAFTQDSASLGLYSFTENDEDAVDFGMFDGTKGAHMGLSWGTHQYITRMNNGNPSIGPGGGVRSFGYHVSSRTQSSEYRNYERGTLAQTVAESSSALASREMYVCCWNFDGSAASFSTKDLGLIEIGAGRTAGEISADTTIFNTLMAAW